MIDETTVLIIQDAWVNSTTLKTTIDSIKSQGLAIEPRYFILKVAITDAWCTYDYELESYRKELL